jgi:hypothetical protein
VNSLVLKIGFAQDNERAFIISRRGVNQKDTQLIQQTDS